MINKEKIYDMIGLRKYYNERCWDQPDAYEDFYIPITDELSQNIDETIDFLEGLDADYFTIVLEALEELIQKTRSQRLIDAVRRIGKEKGIDKKYLEEEIEYASQIFSAKETL